MVAGAPSISIVVPVFNEAANIEVLVNELKQVTDDVIVVDGGSQDDTCARAAKLDCRLVQAPRGRGRQMNDGASWAKGDVLLFLHADTRLPESARGRLAEFFASSHAWGRFDVRLSGAGWRFCMIAWFMNWRSHLTGICTGDQAMFVRREVFLRTGGFASIPLMEDIEYSKRLKQVSRPFRIVDPVVTSSRRWEQNGVWRTVFKMWRFRLRYFMGAAPETLAKEY